MNRLNGKVYIGQTTHSLEKRWGEHCREKRARSAISKAIIKYGKEYFSIDLVARCASRDILNSCERYFIQFYKTMAPNGYNLESGGTDQKNASELTRLKMSIAKFGKRRGPMNLSHKMALSLANKDQKGKCGKDHPFFGKKHSKESRAKMSSSLKGNTPWNKGLNTGNPWNKGLKNHLSLETKEKMSLSQYKRFSKNNPWNKGQSLSEETKRKISESQRGSLNHMYGKKYYFHPETGARVYYSMVNRNG